MLFLRLIFKDAQIYTLKVVTLAFAFASSIVIVVFSFHEFGFDQFHADAERAFRVLTRNESENFNGNRLSSRVSVDMLKVLRSLSKDSVVVSPVKLMEDVSIRALNRDFFNSIIYAADSNIVNVFSFSMRDGVLGDFAKTDRSALISASAAVQLFGKVDAAGGKFDVGSDADTVTFRVVGVFEDYPSNSHGDFDVFISYDQAVIHSLKFDSADTQIYGRTVGGSLTRLEKLANAAIEEQNIVYKLQPLPEIYFGPRVEGENAKHGDAYSIFILICVSFFILVLAFGSLLNLTTLTLPKRSKELAIKKLAGTTARQLLLAFFAESVAITGIALVIGILILISCAEFIASILSLEIFPVLKYFGGWLSVIVLCLFVFMAVGPVLMTFQFTKASPVRLLSTDTITFPQFKRVITFLQLTLSIFLIITALVMKRQINYSLLKEPGRNYDQIVYLRYPSNLTDEGLLSLRLNWKKYNPNIIDVMATSALPHTISSRETASGLYLLSVDPGYSEFFNLTLKKGRWFRPNDGDSMIIVNTQAYEKLDKAVRASVIGVIHDLNPSLNIAEKPVKIRQAPYYHYNFLCIRVLEVDIRKTAKSLAAQFQVPSLSFLNPRFEEWLLYQDRLNTLSNILAVIAAALSCLAIYGLSISVVRDKTKQIAIHKMFGASMVNITRLLMISFIRDMLFAIAVATPVTYIFLKEWLREFVYTTQFQWSDLLLPVGYCILVIVGLCSFHARTLNRSDLTSALKN